MNRMGTITLITAEAWRAGRSCPSSPEGGDASRVVEFEHVDAVHVDRLSVFADGLPLKCHCGSVAGDVDGSCFDCDLL